MERIFYKPVMKSGKSFQIYVPQDAIKALEILDRDELKITIEKTGNSIEKTEKFVRKEIAKDSLEDELDEAERDFVDKYKETDGDAIVLQKAVDQFGPDRVKVLLKSIKKVVESAPQGK